MERLAFVFFIYGLAFFAMGLAIALESRRPSDLLLSRPIRYLAAFGLLHAAVEWVDMWLIGPGAASPAAPTLRILRLALFAASTVALAQFGSNVIVSIRPHLRLLRWVPLALALFWTLNWAVIPHLTPVRIDPVAHAPSCMRCHGGAPPTGPDSVAAGLAPATALADVWLRYLVYLPASLLAAAAFWMEGRRLGGLDYPFIAKACRWIGIAFAANAIMAGLIVPPAPFFPASLLNYDRFLSAVGVPPQLLRAAIAAVIAWLTLRVLRVFDLEASRRLAQAGEARLAAQQQALEAVQDARAAAEMWSRTLEERVAARTRELEGRTRELAALNAIASTVTSSLDLQTILESTVDSVLDLIGGEGGGVTLYPAAAGGAPTRVLRGPAGGEVERVGGFEQGAVATGTVAFSTGGQRPFLTVPLRAKDRLMGELTVLGASGRAFTPDEVGLVTTVAQQVGVAVENARLFGETLARRREAETLHRLGTEIAALSDVQRVLDLVVRSARELMGADAAMLSLLDQPRARLVLRAAAGLRTDALMGIELAPGQGVAGRVVQAARPLIVEDYVADPGITHELDSVVRQEGLRTHVGVPIAARGQTEGCLVVAFRQIRSAGDDDVRLLLQMASQAAIAIENARLYEQVQSLAILEERDRLGREMHDSLGQSLGLLNLKVKLVEDLVTAGRTHEAEEELGQVRRTIREAYDEVRHAILGLRTSGAREDLEVAMRVQVARFREQSRLPASFEVDGVVPPVTALAAVQITRIVQEALTNVRKHAQATEVQVSLKMEDGRLLVRVRDNGRGFDVGAVQQAAGARFGLETMRERAESVGGTLEVISAPGEGATITLTVPVPVTPAARPAEGAR